MHHKLSLKRNLLAKHKHKYPVATSMVVHVPEALGEDAPLAELATTCMLPIVTAAVTSASDSVQSAIIEQVQLMFAPQILTP